MKNIKREIYYYHQKLFQLVHLYLIMHLLYFLLIFQIHSAQLSN